MKLNSDYLEAARSKEHYQNVLRLWKGRAIAEIKLLKFHKICCTIGTMFPLLALPT